MTEKTKRKSKNTTAKAKKKTAVARAAIRPGKGITRINGLNLNAVVPIELREFISEPIELTKPVSGELDVDVSVKGGGFMGQAVAARAAIAKAIYNFKGNEKMRKSLLVYDRMLLVDDPRRVESKKPLGTKARKKKQKSKR